MKYRLYILICPVSKCVRYVGITTKPLDHRLSRHLRDDKKRNPHKYNWIQKLRRDNLEPQIKLVCDNLTKEQAAQKEIQLILIYKGIVGKKLTNIHEGGNLPPIFTGHSIKTRKKMAKVILQFSRGGELIKRHELGTRQIFQELKIDRRDITKCCFGRIKSAGGFVWRFEEDSFEKFNSSNTQLEKPVWQYGMDGKFIKKFKSQSEAARLTGISSKYISRCCTKVRKSAGGFKWRYA